MIGVASFSLLFFFFFSVNLFGWGRHPALRLLACIADLVVLKRQVAALMTTAERAAVDAESEAFRADNVRVVEVRGRIFEFAYRLAAMY